MAAEYTMTMERARRLRERCAEMSRFMVDKASFPEMRERNCYYIDKTGYVYDMTHAGLSYVFLSRPRRFGKSLLVSTLKSYFEGRRGLFRGLAIDLLEKEWQPYPVLHLDLGRAKGKKDVVLKRFLIGRLAKYEREYGLTKSGETEPDERFARLIEHVYNSTGRKVVVLIDEYDAAMLDIVHEEKDLPEIRNIMRCFFSTLKEYETCLRFVFITGITKFSQVSIFSALNNIKDISMDRKYAAICGITREELRYRMRDEVDKFALTLGITREKMMQKVKLMYDGYHFCWPSPDIYNPFSLMNALYDKELNSYWFASGTPTYLIEMLKKFKVAPSEIGGNKVMANSFHAPTEQMTDIIPLLYQSGYLTITDYNPDSDLYTLDIPNNEVSSGLFDELLPYYVNIGRKTCDAFNGEMKTAMECDDIDKMMTLFKEFFASIPHVSNTNYEGHYQQIMYIVYKRLTKDVHLEEHTAEGRIDLVVEFNGRAYIFELKLDGSAAEALRQIDAKDYAARYAFEGLPVVKVGVSFDSKARTISAWAVER